MQILPRPPACGKPQARGRVAQSSRGTAGPARDLGSDACSRLRAKRTRSIDAQSTKPGDACASQAPRSAPSSEVDGRGWSNSKTPGIRIRAADSCGRVTKGATSQGAEAGYCLRPRFFFMPYKDKHKQSAWQTKFQRKRRLKWLRNNGPCKSCGSWRELQVDHKDPRKKITHRVWSWSEKRRSKELRKCQALCKPCHKRKSDEAMRRPAIHGSSSCYRRGCRCELCRFTHSVEMKKYRLAKQ